MPGRLAGAAERHTAAGVHEEGNARWRIRVRLDADDFPSLTVLGDDEVFRIEGADHLALFVAHHRRDRDEIDPGLERRHRLLGDGCAAAEQQKYRERVRNPAKEHAVSLTPADRQGRLNLFSSGAGRNFTGPAEP